MLRMLLVLSILVPGLVLALFSRQAGLLLYLWFALFRPQEFLWFDISQWRLSIVIGALLVVPSVLTGVLPDLKHPLSLGAVAFLGCALLAQTNAVDPAIGWYWLDFMARLVLVCLLLVTLVQTRQQFFMAVAVIAGSFGFHSAKAGLGSLLGGGVRFFEGTGGAFPDNNGYAVGTVMIIFLLVAIGQNASRRFVRWAFLAAAPLSAIAVVSTFSRSGFLALAGATLAFAALQKKRASALMTVGLLACIGIVFVPLPEGYADRLQTIRTYEEVGDTSAMGRLHFWRVAVNMATDRPLGVGLFNYERAYNDYDFLDGLYGRGRSVHSSDFQVLAETGFMGMVVWVFLFAYGFRTAFRIRARARLENMPPDAANFCFTMANGLIASMIGFLIGGAFIALALNDLTWLTFGLITALDRLSIRLSQKVVEPVPVQVPTSGYILPAAGYVRGRM